MRATLALAAPLVGVQLAQMSMSFVDVVMVGRLGTEAMAAAVLGSTVFFTTVLLGIGIVLAVQPTVAQATGAGRPAGAAEAARQGLWLGTLVGLPLFVAMGFAEDALLWSGQSPETAALAAGYIRAIRWGLLPDLWFTALRGLCEGVARPRPILVVTLAATALNAGLNYVFMFGGGGLVAPMGVVGTGWASALTLTMMAGAMALYVHAGPLRGYRVLAGLGRPHPATLGTLFRLGWPIGVALGLEAGLFSAATLLVGRLGDVALAAHQVALNAASVAFMVPLGIGMATSVRVGQAVGAGDAGGAARAGWAGIALGAAFMCATALLFWTRPGWVIGLYTGAAPDPAVASLAASLLAVAAVFQVFDGTQAAAGGALRGLKDTRGPMLIGAASYWGVGLTAAAVFGLVRGGGAPGLWWGLTLGLAVAAVLLVARFRVQTRRLAAGQPPVSTVETHGPGAASSFPGSPT